MKWIHWGKLKLVKIGINTYNSYYDCTFQWRLLTDKIFKQSYCKCHFCRLNNIWINKELKNIPVKWIFQEIYTYIFVFR